MFAIRVPTVKRVTLPKRDAAFVYEWVRENVFVGLCVSAKLTPLPADSALRRRYMHLSEAVGGYMEFSGTD